MSPHLRTSVPLAPSTFRTSRTVRAAAILVAVWAAAATGLARLPPVGLRGEYFTTADWAGTPAHGSVDGEISTAQISRAWRYDVPDRSSVQWFGWLLIDRAGGYVFRTAAAGRCQLQIDNRTVVDARLAGVADGAIHLDPGPHAIVLRFAPADAGHRFEWTWAAGSAPSAPVPAWRMSPWRVRRATLVARRWLNAFAQAAAMAVLVIAGVALWRFGSRHIATPDRRRIARALPRAAPGPALASLALFVALAVAHTWPLAASPARLSRNDNADTLLNEWAVAWVAHQAPRRPLALFEGNIFYPERHALAFSEPLIPQGLMAAPLLAFGASPVAAYNIVLMIGFALTGWAMCLVMRSWTGRWLPGIAAGAIVAFNAHTLTRLPHIQAQHAEFLPLALFAFDALLIEPRWTTAVAVAVWTAFQASGSIYLFVFTLVALAAGFVVRPGDWVGDRFARVAPKLALAAALGAALVTPLLLPYWQLHRSGFSRSLDEAAFFAAAPTDYLATQSRIYARAAHSAALFPGAIALVLAAVALTAGAARDARARMAVAFGACGVLLSFGPALGAGYDALYSAVPLISAIRVSARFGYLGIVAVAVMAGFGVDAIGRAISPRSRGAALAAMTVASALVALEPLAAPISYTPAGAIPGIYALPAGEANAVDVDLPFPPPDAPFRNGPFILDSTRNWRPLLNGYSGFLPPSYVAHYEALRDFPAPGAIAALRTLGVTRLFVHFDQMPPGAREVVEREPALRRVAAEGDVALYALDNSKFKMQDSR